MKERKFYESFDSYLTKNEYYNLTYKPQKISKSYQKHLNFGGFLRNNFIKRFYKTPFYSSLHIKPYLNCCTLKLIDSIFKISSSNSSRKKVKFFGSYKEVFGEMERVITASDNTQYKGEFLYVAPFGGKIILIFKADDPTLCFFCQSSVHIISYSRFMEKEHGNLVKNCLYQLFFNSLLPKIKELPETHPLFKIIKRSDFPIIL